MKSFFRKVRLHFENQPLIHARILKDIQTALWEPSAKLDDLKGLAGKIFKSSQHLHDEFLSLFPSVSLFLTFYVNWFTLILLLNNINFEFPKPPTSLK